VLLGAFLKFVLNEGLTRWQLATGSTLLEGTVERLGKPIGWLFLAYLLAWSFFVAAALMGAVGVTCHAICPLAGDGVEAAGRDKIIYGLSASVLTIVLVEIGGYRLFEKLMSVCIAVMFVVVVVTAIALRPELREVARGLAVPVIPPGGASWTIALIGGVGGTVTLLVYGYWIREEGRASTDDLATCRVDLAAGYAMTAFFGLSMIVIGNSLGKLPGGGATLVVEIADRLELTFGRAGTLARWAFLAGAFGAVFSSMFGVWQSIPYLFADLWRLLRAPRLPGTPVLHAKVDARSLPYRVYLYALAVVPVIGMIAVDFRAMQKSYAIVGALFVPMLAVVLLMLCGRTAWIGKRYRNSWITTLVLVGTTLIFVYAGALEVYEQLYPPPQ
jgi:Mn2+/Fe2+ NRAMP family transporter